MKTPEAAVNDAVVNPASRLMILLFGTWLIGSLYPIPETVFCLIRGPVVHGYWTVTHTPRWLDFRFVPVIGTLFSKTFLVSGPIALFCVVCSALDRWDWRKVTGLSALSTLSMNVLEDWADDEGWITLTLYQALIVTLLLVIVRALRQP
jgi:hypothetical protein